MALNASERRNKAERLLREARQESIEAEKALTEMGIKTIQVEGKYAEDHAEEIEEERQEIINSQTQNKAGSREGDESKDKNREEKEGDKSADETEKTNKDGFVEIFDRWGCGEDDR